MNLLAGAQPYAVGGESFACAVLAAGNAFSIELKTIPGQHLIGGTLNNTAVRLIWVSTLTFEDAVEASHDLPRLLGQPPGGWSAPSGTPIRGRPPFIHMIH